MPVYEIRRTVDTRVVKMTTIEAENSDLAHVSGYNIPDDKWEVLSDTFSNTMDVFLAEE